MIEDRNSAALTRLFLGAVLALWAGPALAGAWTQGKGVLYDRIALCGYRADREFDGDGDRRDLAHGGTFTDVNVSNYLEYGLTDRVTGVASVPYKVVRKDDDTRETTSWGVGDIDLAVKVKAAEGAFGVVSAQGLVKIPEAYDEDDDLPLGNGQYDLEARLLWGRSLWPALPGYAGLEVGYRWRLDDPSDEVRYLVELGGDVTRRLYVRAKLDGTYSMDNGRRRDEGGNPTARNNYDLGKLDLTLGWRLNDRWALEAGFAPELYGQNTAAGASACLALAYRAP